MRSDLIRVKRPVWVRIVNPEPVMTFRWMHRHGDIRLMRPGGRIHVQYPLKPRALAFYEAPALTSEAYECPTGAMLFRPIDDFRLLVDGVDDQPPHELPISPTDRNEPAAEPMTAGDSLLVVKTRRVRAVPPPTVHTRALLAPYREGFVERHDARASVWTTLRRGGRLLVTEVRRPRLRVVYLADPFCVEEQCENGSFFWMSEAEFHRMKAYSAELLRHEAEERREVLRILRSP